MSRSVPTSPGDGEAIEARAAAWLAQRDEGLTPEEAAEFAQWQQADPRHAAAVARLDATWTALQQLRTFRPRAQAHPDRDLLRRPRARIVRFPNTLVAALIATAAALAVIAWISRPFSFKTTGRVEPTSEYVTSADGYQRVTLSDVCSSDPGKGEKCAWHTFQRQFSAGRKHDRLGKIRLWLRLPS